MPAKSSAWITVLLIATENMGKWKEFKSLIGNVLPMPTENVPQIIEDGGSYYENALKKAIGYFQAFRVPVLSDDSGLEIKALGGAPGLHSARFGGLGISWQERRNLILEKLANQTDRSAQFRAVLCYYDGKGVPLFVEETVQGEILLKEEGKGGFGYDPLFYSSALKKSYGTATLEEKQSDSHRAKAIKKLMALLDLGLS